MNQIEDLEKVLGSEGVVRFLKDSLPVFKGNLTDLLRDLETEDWEKAKFIAHKMLATCDFFSSPVFRLKLDKIIEMDVEFVQTRRFRRTLVMEAETTLRFISDRYHVE